MSSQQTRLPLAEWRQKLQEPDGLLGTNILSRGLVLEVQESFYELRAQPGDTHLAELMDILRHLSVQVYGGELEARLGPGAWSDGTYVFIAESFLAQLAQASLDISQCSSLESQGLQPRLTVERDPRRFLPLHHMLLACVDSVCSPRLGQPPRFSYPGVRPAPDLAWVQEQFQALPGSRQFMQNNGWPEQPWEDLQSRRMGTHPEIVLAREYWDALIHATLNPDTSPVPSYSPFATAASLPHSHPVSVSVRAATDQWLRAHIDDLPTDTPPEDVFALCMTPTVLPGPQAMIGKMGTLLEANARHDFLNQSTQDKLILARRTSQSKWFTKNSQELLIDILSGYCHEVRAPGHIPALRLHLMTSLNRQPPPITAAVAEVMFNTLCTSNYRYFEQTWSSVAYMHEWPEVDDIFIEIASGPAMKSVLAGADLQACSSTPMLAAALEEQYTQGVPAQIQAGKISPESQHASGLSVAWRQRLWQDMPLHDPDEEAAASFCRHFAFEFVRSWPQVDTMLSAGVPGSWQQQGQTLLHVLPLCSPFPGRHRTLEALLGHGVDPKAVDTQGRTAWDAQLSKTYFEHNGSRTYTGSKYAFPALVRLLQTGVPFSNTAVSWDELLANLDDFINAKKKKKLPSQHLQVLEVVLDEAFTVESIAHLKSSSAVQEGTPAGQWALGWVAKHERRILNDAVTATTSPSARRLRV
jgi:hypothetical protein